MAKMAGRGRKSAAAAGEGPARRCNLERFLEATTPVVTSSSCSAKESKNGCRLSYSDDPLPFFTLLDLWESFRECSAYGTAVPIVLNGSREEIIQYYVPYLSAIQLYGALRRHVGPSRTSAEETDSDTCQDTCSDLDHETSSSTNTFSAQETSETASSSEDEGESGNYHEQLLFEFVESESPYQRQPLADKISSLAKRFPELNTLRSCDLSPASWISVAWYPIYRIPTGPTLDACFLTYHSLSTQFAGASHSPKPKASNAAGACGPVPVVTGMWLPAFATESYKLKSATWTPTWRDRQLAASLAQAADAWLRLLRCDHSDHRFFVSRRAPRR